jgi:hypothetical protein
MALDASILAADIDSRFSTLYTDIPEFSSERRLEAIQLLAEAIVDHILNNAQILPGTFAYGAGAITGEGQIL